VRYMTRTNSTTFIDADILALMKIRQDEIAKAILKTDDDILLIPQTTSLVANQREYAFPEDILLKIKRVEAKLNGTDWVKLSQKDITEFTWAITETNITDHFSNYDGYAFYDLSRKAIYLLSGTVSVAADGLKIWVNTYPTAISDLSSNQDMSVDPTTTTHGIPREMHEIWARGVIIDYKGSREKPIPLTEKELKYETDKIEAINSLCNQDMDKEITGKLPPSSTRGDNGYNY
jgi:hypothetical protein